ncbi:S8 family serine peptidase [Streptomyces sp. NPDC026673]|uniref:S8 family peptidase n=1 Tax=Streptomyces sp. NPDC026673 TaxID=3155724 RepID=UPI0034054B17
MVGPDGQPTTILRATGREKVPLQIQRTGEHTYVVPLDAQHLLDTGRVDRRLFDVTLLSQPEYRAQQRDGLRMIVTYQGELPAARQAMRAGGDGEVTRSFEQPAADAIKVPVRDVGSVWRTLTESASDGSVTAAPGVRKIWLDALVKASLDRSVPQIGGPEAWSAGYDGTGVRIAVLDTGVDTSHPDLATQVSAERNFTDSPDLRDHYGHGTHVASIAAGTGVKSGGVYKGVAPGARILAGKVVNDDGWGETSGIIAGMEWAVEQGADIINLSLGSEDTPGLDPMEEAVDRLSATSDTLFVVAAGNSGGGGPGTVESPGSADAALTVGAVTKTDQLADFSSTGPRTGDGALKPDVTAPGVAITAAAAAGSFLEQNEPAAADGYLSLDGTSMATPHATGAAALLKQQHPQWTGERLKAALAGSAAPGEAYSAFQQGTGRIDLRNAIKATALAESGPVSFGTQSWPHDNDQPVTKNVVYRNTGTESVTLDLTVDATGPDGNPAPAGLFTLGASQITVPSGGTRSVAVTADTRPDTATGIFSGAVIASGADRVIRTAIGVDRESEAYDVKIRHIGRDGGPAPVFFTSIQPYDQGPTSPGSLSLSQETPEPGDDGARTVRLPKGRYVVVTTVPVDADLDPDKGVDRIVRPLLDLTQDVDISADARTARPVDLAMSDAPQVSGSLSMAVATTGNPGRPFVQNGIDMHSLDSLRTAHAGTRVPKGSMTESADVAFRRGPAAPPYRMFRSVTATRASTGITEHTSEEDYAGIAVRVGRQTRGSDPMTARYWAEPQGQMAHTPTFRTGEIPTTGRVFVQANTGVSWSLGAQGLTADDEAVDWYETEYSTYAPGSLHTIRLTHPVFSPALPAGSGAFRDGADLSVALPLLADGDGHAPPLTLQYDSARLTLRRGGEVVGTREGLPDGSQEPFQLTPEAAKYRLTASVSRPAGKYPSSKVTAAWTFTSQRTSERTPLPLSVVRFTPRLAADGTGEAGATLRVPVTVVGAAAGNGLESLAVDVSTDRGATWTSVAVSNGRVNVRNPDAGGSISFRVRATDRNGAALYQKIIDAYFTR